MQNQNQYQNPNRPANPNFVPMIIKFALMASVFVYLFVLFAQFQFQMSEFDPASFMANELNPMLAMMSVISIVMASVLPKILAKANDSQNSSGQSHDQDIQNDPVKMHQKYFVPFVIQLVLYESVAVYGFIVGFLSKDPVFMVPFAVVALAFMSMVKMGPGKKKMGAQY